MKRFLVAFLICLNCHAYGSLADNGKQDALLSVIEQRQISDSKLIKDMSELGMPPSEPASYWASMANDPTHGILHRECAIGQLFQRHVYVGMRLSEFESMIGTPNWTNAQSIIHAEFVTGLSPIRTPTMTLTLS